MKRRDIVRKIRKITAAFLAMMILVSALSGCSGSKPTGDGGGSGDGTENANVPLINDGKPVTIIVNLGEYGPSDNEEPTEDAPTVFNSTRKLIEKFEKLHPNVTVELDKSFPTTGGDYVASLNQWMLPRLAAGTQMDIACNLSVALFGDNGWFMNISDELEKPNEYIKEGEAGSKRWADIYPSYVFSNASVINTNSEVMGVPYMMDCGSPTAYFYNKEIFKELNLEVPQTWEEMFKVCEVIGKAGYIPFAPHAVNTNSDLQCWDTQFSLGPVYAQYMLDAFDYNGDGRQDMQERVRAVKEGLYDATKHTYALDIWKQVKRKYASSTSPILQDGYQTTDYDPLWNEGKVAIYEGLMASLPYMNSNTDIDFEFGLFPPPVISNDTYDYLPEAQFTEAGPTKPGVTSSWVFLTKSMEEKDPAVKEACIAFVKFMTAPENMSAVVLEKRGAVLGAASDCVIPPELKDWMQQKFPIYPDTTGWLPINTSDYRQQGNKLLDQWLYGEIDDNTFATKLNEISQADADAIIETSGLDTTGWAIGGQ